MSAKLQHYQLARALERFESVRDAFLTQLRYVAEAEIAALAHRFPTRRIEFHSGMGVSQIVISKRNPRDGLDDYNYSDGGQWCDWPERCDIPAPDLWSAIRLYCDNVSDSGNDPGIGTIIFENGKRLTLKEA